MPPSPGSKPSLITVAAIILGLSAYLVGVPFLDRIELDTLDIRFRLRGTRPPAHRVVLAAIDEASIEREGKWPWPRTRLARLVRRLTEAGARVVAFDIGFLEPDQKWSELLTELRTAASADTALAAPAEDCLGLLAGAADPDRLLAEAIRDAESAGTRVVLGFFFHTGGTADHLDPDAVPSVESIADAAFPIQSASADARRAAVPRARAPAATIPEIAAAAGSAGHFNMIPDADGVVRRIPMAIGYGDQFFAPLSLVAAAAFAERTPAIRIDRSGVRSVRLGETKIPVDPNGRMRINYRGPESTFPYLPVTDILRKDAPESAWRTEVRDALVIVGATAVGIYDVRVTPFDNVFPGPEIHATIVDNLLAGDFLRKPGAMVLLDALGMAGGAILLGFLLSRLGAGTGAAAAAGIAGLWLVAAQYLFSRRGLVLAVVHPLVTLGTLYAAVTLWRLLLEARQRRFIQNAFAHYVSPAVVEELIRSPEKLELRGEERHITAFFSDIEGFSRIAEGMDPRRLGEFLNEFLTEMTDIILAHRGMVDKFEGDAIIAMFGAPNAVPDHPAVACRAAVEMQRRLVEMRRGWRERGWPEIRMRIGLCTGAAVVGNMGSRSRMDYTMIGDTVNTAARLEGINKFYGTYTAAAESTIRAMGDELVAREVDRIHPVGKKQAIRFYELLGTADAVVGDMPARYAEGLAAYRNREWDRAIAAFEAALRAVPEDGPSRVLLERSRNFRADPPPPEWDAVFAAAGK